MLSYGEILGIPGKKPYGQINTEPGRQSVLTCQKNAECCSGRSSVILARISRPGGRTEKALDKEAGCGASLGLGLGFFFFSFKKENMNVFHGI